MRGSVRVSAQARDGQVLLGKHFPGGSGSPAIVVVPAERLQDAAVVLLGSAGVDGVSVVSADSPRGSATVTADALLERQVPDVVDRVGRLLAERQADLASRMGADPSAHP